MNDMHDRIPIGLTLAKCGPYVHADEVYDFIATETRGAAAYAYRPHGMAAAALDFYLVLGAIGSVASIASIIWQAYDHFIASRKSPKDPAGIYIAVRRPDGTVIDIMVGRDVLTKEDLIQRMELIVGEANDPAFHLTHEATISEIESSNSWVRLDRKP